jgi:hypothetical protein
VDFAVASDDDVDDDDSAAAAADDDDDDHCLSVDCCVAMTRTVCDKRTAAGFAGWTHRMLLLLLLVFAAPAGGDL